jgi:hypothetical protein
LKVTASDAGDTELEERFIGEIADYSNISKPKYYII